MSVSEWASYQEGKANAQRPNFMPVRNLYPEPKKDRREPKEKKR